MATLADLRASVLGRLGMDDTASGTDEGLVDQWLNEGVREVLIRTHCHVNAIDLTLTANEWKYDLPTSVLALKYVTDSDSNPVQVVDFQDILDLRRTLSSGHTSNPRMAVLGSNLLAVWPTPTAADTWQAFYVPLPTEMSTGSHDPSNATYGKIPVAFHHAIELWALSKGSDHEHEGRTQNGVKYEQEFELYIARVVRATVNRTGGRRGAARVGRRPLIARSNDVYPRY